MLKHSEGSWSRQWTRVRVEGPDAEDFLHRLTTVQVKAMPVGETRRGFLLNPQGRIRSAFFLHRRASPMFWLELDGGHSGNWTRECLEALEQFHFGEKLEFREESGKPRWILGEEPSLSACDGIRHGRSDFGIEWISVWPDFGISSAGRLISEPIGDADLEDLRIRNLTPRVDHEITPLTNPLEIGWIDGIAQNKGCYPGQEVIEKVISLGSPAKRLALIEGRELQVGKTVSDSTGELGTLTSVTRDGTQGLALVRKTAAALGHLLTNGRVARISGFGQP